MHKLKIITDRLSRADTGDATASKKSLTSKSFSLALESCKYGELHMWWINTMNVAAILVHKVIT